MRLSRLRACFTLTPLPAGSYLAQVGFPVVRHGINQHAGETRLDAVHVGVRGSPSELHPHPRNTTRHSIEVFH
jgi:hypothetical protein